MKESIENIWVEIFLTNSHSFLFCCVYRPPDSSKHLSKMLHNDLNDPLQSSTKEIIIMGECNVNYANRRDNCEFKSILSLNGSVQLIKQPT